MQSAKWTWEKLSKLWTKEKEERMRSRGRVGEQEDKGEGERRQGQVVFDFLGKENKIGCVFDHSSPCTNGVPLKFSNLSTAMTTINLPFYPWHSIPGEMAVVLDHGGSTLPQLSHRTEHGWSLTVFARKYGGTCAPSVAPERMCWEVLVPLQG